MLVLGHGLGLIHNEVQIISDVRSTFKSVSWENDHLTYNMVYCSPTNYNSAIIDNVILILGFIR